MYAFEDNLLLNSNITLFEYDRIPYMSFSNFNPEVFWIISIYRILILEIF